MASIFEHFGLNEFGGGSGFGIFPLGMRKNTHHVEVDGHNVSSSEIGGSDGDMAWHRACTNVSGRGISMNTGRIVTAGVILALAMPWISLRAQGSASPAAPAAEAGMMMSSCEHHQAMEAALTTIEKLVADTKTSKDVAALHTTLDQIGSEVTKMQESKKKCTGMMEMMQKMGKMKSNSPSGDEQHQHK